MLNSEETNSLCAKVESNLCIVRVISIGTYTKYTILVHNIHILYKERILRCIHCLKSNIVNTALCTVK